MSTHFPFGSHTSIISNISEQWIGKVQPYVPCKDTSLSRLSMVSFITNLWSDGTLEEHLQSILMDNKSLLNKRKFLIKKATEIVERLELPTVVIKQMLILVEWISSDFIAYLDRLMSNEFYPYKGNIGDIVKKIKWDRHGAIDEVQTFRNMKYDNYHYNYIVSTLYSLEEDIPMMWARLSPVYKPIFSLKKIYSGGFDSYATFIIYYWTCRVKNRTFRIHSLEDPIGLFNNVQDSSIELKMLIVSLHCYNVHSFKYFWRKLNSNEKIIGMGKLCDTYETDDLCGLGNYFETVKNSTEIILFALSQIDDNRRLMVIRRCLSQMIVNFWQCWQVHHVIMPLFESYIDFLDSTAYKLLFNRLQAQTGEYSPKGKLLCKMWLASPPHLQCLITEEEKQAMFSGIPVKQINPIES